MSDEKPKRWHGLTHEQVMAIWDEYGWKGRVTKTLREVAECEHAEPDDRIMLIRLTPNEPVASV